MSRSSRGPGEQAKRSSAVVLRALDTLLIKNPERSAIGVVLGLAIQGMAEVCSPLLARSGFDLGRLEWWGAISLGLVLVHAPFVIWSMRHRPLISDELESLIELIESTNIGESERRVAYRRVVNKCIDQFSLASKPGTISGIVAGEVEEDSEPAK